MRYGRLGYLAFVLLCICGFRVVCVAGAPPKPAAPNAGPTSAPPSPAQPAQLRPGQTSTNSVGMKLAYIPAAPEGFLMGSPAGEARRYSDETQHQVRITEPFLIGTTEVTQAQWQAVMGPGSNPSHFRGDNLPVETVSWDDAVEFCRKLSQKEGRQYRLPTEAEWEYACRAGTTTAYHPGNDEQALARAGWYFRNSNDQTRPVAQKQANAWGLYDMHGNVWEWCADWYSGYPNGEAVDPTGPANGQYRVLRGGSWNLNSKLCRAANRHWHSPDLHTNGFRVVCVAGAPQNPVAPNAGPTSAPASSPAQPAQSQPAETITNSIGMKLAYIPAGPEGFLMGSPGNEIARDDGETQHRVRISQPFLMGTTEVTQAQWQAIMGPGSNPSHFKGDNLPVEQVSWNDAVEFCRKLSQKEGRQYRLPTEAEWEYACRAGTTTAYSTGNDEQALARAGWFGYDTGNASKQTHPVAQKQANAWGLYDMHGNVWEWCNDWYGDYPNGEVVDPTGPANGQSRVLRGGSWFYPPQYCRAAYRLRLTPALRIDYLYGFRVVCVAGAPPKPAAPNAGPTSAPAPSPAQPAQLLPGQTSTNSIGMKLAYIPAAPEGPSIAIVTGLSMKPAYIPAGPVGFLMGSPANEPGRGEDETQHRVRISKPFWMGTTEVTQAQWRAVMGTTVAQQRANPTFALRGEGDNHPMYYVSWNEAVEFCRKLSQKEGRQYRLPTEAEWEYACRAGATTAYYTGNDEQALGRAGWYGYDRGNANKQTHPVAQKQANAWGLYDMHGNVLEWCGDWYGDYPNGEVVDLTGPVNGQGRVLRGGSWLNTPRYCRAAYRDRGAPDDRINYYGFRVVLAGFAAGLSE